MTKKWFPWGINTSKESLEDHAKRLLRGKNVVDVRIVPDGGMWELEFAKELTSDEEVEVKTRQTSLEEIE